MRGIATGAHKSQAGTYHARGWHHGTGCRMLRCPQLAKLSRKRLHDGHNPKTGCECFDYFVF